MVFRYTREFVADRFDEILFMRMMGARVHSIEKAVELVIDSAASYASAAVGSLMRRLSLCGYDAVLVFGSGSIKEKESLMKERTGEKLKRRGAVDDLFTKDKCISPGLALSEGKIQAVVASYMFCLVDEIRNKTKVMVSAAESVSFVEDVEPDIYCPRNCKVVVTEDFDHVLFGAEIVVVITDFNTFKYIHEKDISDQLFEGNGTVEMLIKACVLCGTDYNVGVPTIGAKRSVSIVTENPEDPRIDKEAVRFFDEKRNHVSWKKESQA